MIVKTDHLLPFGYCGLFSSRNDLNEVWDWINQLTDTEKAAASTAAGMATNTLLRVLDGAGMLRKPESENRRMIVVMENGVYQTTLANFDCEDISLAYVEYDEHGDPCDMIDIPQSNGSTAMAYASIGNQIIRESDETLNIDQVFQSVQEGNNDGSL